MNVAGICLPFCSMPFSLTLVLCTALVAVAASSQLRHGGPPRKPSPNGYSFAQFSRDFDRNYASGSAEYASRAAVFEASLNRINVKNAENKRKGSTWLAGVHPFMDWTQAERTSLKGYKPNRGPRSRVRISALQLSQGDKMQSNMSWSARDTDSTWEGAGGTDGTDSIALRNQGNCGSCWAISAVEAVEARLPSKTQVSAQALVDCVPNPRHCGGTGGCDGATGELAYEYIRDHGLPLESSYGYTGTGDSCHADTAYPTAQRVKISGWTNLESNKAQPLMDALYNSGPVVVAVAADEWFDYDQGIFDGCAKDAVLDHAVLAKGYGGEGSSMWWRIQNSWGGRWGEEGHIRLKRRDAAEESAYCGQDKKPSDGLGCDGGPSEVTVCGTCGILYDPIFPEGVTLEGDSSETSSFSSRSAASAVPTRSEAVSVTSASASSDYYESFLKDDNKETRMPASKPQVETAAVSQSAGPDLADIFSASDEFKVPVATPEANPEVKKSDTETNEIDRMKNLFQHNFLQAS